MSVDVTRSSRQVTDRSASIQKRRTLYIADTDPRAKNLLNNAAALSAYENKYYAEVKIVPEAQYIELLRHQIGTDVFISDNYTEPDPTAPATTVKTLHPPLNLWWDAADPNSVKYNETNTGATVDVLITFDPAIDDVLTDGQITYFVEAVPTTVAAASTSTSSTSTKFANVGTVTTTSATSAKITLRWNNISNATGYLVTVTGKNMPNQGTAPTKTYHSNPTPTSSTHSFSITPAIPLVLQGTYTFKIQVVYSNGTSTGVTKSVSV